MSSTPSNARPRPARASRADGGRGSRTRSATAASIPTVSAEQRHALIAEAAYRRAERRGFEGGDPVADWLESEREVEILLSRTAD